LFGVLVAIFGKFRERALEVGGDFDSPCTLPQTALTPRILAFRIAVKYENVRAADAGAF
jgi:hypothetical protein